MSFTEDMERLQAIVEEFESDSLTMEDSLALFEEGVKLIRGCREYLAKAKRRVTALLDESGAESELADGDESGNYSRRS
jgi:exodeoxyribonuclease VII small subunit